MPKNRFNGFRFRGKPLKRLVRLIAPRTWLKPGVNEIGKVWVRDRGTASYFMIEYHHLFISAVVEEHLFGRENEILCRPPARWLRLYR